jgi:hypothetical protein
MSVSTNGACQVDGSCGSSGRPRFVQTQMNEHPVQFGGICLGGTGCGGDPYYGDRSMLEFLSIAFDPKTGAARVILTDSSQSNQATVVTVVRQSTGPSAYDGKASINDKGAFGTSITDPDDDAGFPNFDTLPKQAAPGADITKVQLSLPNGGKTLRVVLGLKDASGLNAAMLTGLGKELFAGIRFTTHDDVFWIGWVQPLTGSGSAAAGHLDCILTCGYLADADIHVTSKGPDAATNTITFDVPVADLKTTLLRPEGVEAPVVQAFTPGKTPLWSVAGYTFAATTSVDDGTLNKNPLDITPSFTFTTTAQTGVTTPTPQREPKGGGNLATTGLPAGVALTGFLLVATAVFLRRRVLARR